MAFEIAKAGWVQRLSTFLRRWKKNWLVLYQDGSLKYFDNPDSHIAEEAIQMATDCRRITSGLQVEADPPAGFGRTCLFAVEVKGDSTWTFCAEGPDDMKAWEMALVDSRGAPMASAPAFPRGTVVYHHADGAHPSPYPGGMNYGPHPPPYAAGPGQTTVIYADHPYRCNRRHYDGGDMAVGMMGGMMLGSLMWGPLLWW